MTTARDLVEDAAAEIGELATDTPLSSADAERILRRLNRMLDSWSNERLMVYELFDETFSTSAGVASYSSSLLASGRPVKVDGVTVRVSNVDYPQTIVSAADYDAIGNKTAGGIPDRVYPQMGYPNATFYFFPVPSGVYTVTVSAYRRLQNGLTLSTTIALPPGYEEAIVSNLAMLIAPMFGTKVSEETALSARESKARIKRVNMQHSEMTIDLPTQRGGQYLDMGVIL